MSWLKSWLKSPVMIWLADLRNFLRTVQSTWKQSIVSCEVDAGRFSENEILLCCHQIFEQYSDFCLKRLVTRWAMSRTACSVCSRSYVCETIYSCYFWTDRNYGLFRYFLLSVQQFTIFFTQFINVAKSIWNKPASKRLRFGWLFCGKSFDKL